MTICSVWLKRFANEIAFQWSKSEGKAETYPDPRLWAKTALGNDAGRKAIAETFAYAWQYWPTLSEITNLAGYSYVRVGIVAAECSAADRWPLRARASQ